MLNQEQTLDYIRKAKSGDERAKEIIFENNSALVKSIIRRFVGKGVEYEDLYQIACIGFLKAIQNFDETFDVKFSTYTVPMIIGEIKRYIRDNGAIKVSRTIKILANKINHFIYQYQTVNNNAPTVDMIANEFKITQEDVVIAMDSAKMPLSLYEKYDDEEEGIELIDKLSYSEDEDKTLNNIHLSNIIDALEEREKKVVIMRYFRDKTQSEIAEHLGHIPITYLSGKNLLHLLQYNLFSAFFVT